MRRGMHVRENFTNELALQRFRSQFDLVRFAIGVAEHRILAGVESHTPQTENLAAEIIEEITDGIPLDEISLEEVARDEKVIELSSEEEIKTAQHTK